MIHYIIPEALAYTKDEIIDFSHTLATTTQETLIDAIVDLWPIAIPVLVVLGIYWFVSRKFGVRR